jgi:hypothetical protein
MATNNRNTADRKRFMVEPLVVANSAAIPALALNDNGKAGIPLLRVRVEA